MKILEGHGANFVHIKNEKSILRGVKKYRYSSVSDANPDTDTDTGLGIGISKNGIGISFSVSVSVKSVSVFRETGIIPPDTGRDPDTAEP